MGDSIFHLIGAVIDLDGSLLILTPLISCDCVFQKTPELAG